MAVPTIGSVSPVLLATGGDQILSVTGTGFRVRPPSDEASAPTSPTVRARVGGVPVRRVDVLSDTRIDVLTPNHAPGPVHLEVANLDDSGIDIPGESVTAVNVATYELQRYTAEYESDLQRLTRMFIRMMREQLLVESNVAIDVDFDQATEDGLNIVKFSSLPGIAIIGPDTREKRPDHGNVASEFTTDPVTGDFVETRPARFVDVIFELIAASNSRMEVLNIQNALISFVQRNPRFCIARSGTAPELGEVCFEFDFDGKDGLPDTGGQPNASNLRQFSARVVIRDVPILDDGDARAGTEGGVPKRSIIRHGRTLADAVSMQTTKKE